MVRLLLVFGVVAFLLSGCGEPVLEYKIPGPQYPGAGTGDVNKEMDGANMDCFYPQDDVILHGDPNLLDPDIPGATIEHKLEIFETVEVVHIRLTLDPRFVDNTYGDNSIGWGNQKEGTHAFDKLVGSDHTQLLLFNGAGETTYDFKIDYISKDDIAASGFTSLGVTDGDGDVKAGDADAILASSTSLDRNLNERGHSAYITDSPATDGSYTPNPDAPDWDFRVVYEVWVATSAFGPSGFDSAAVEYIHASPAKIDSNTVEVHLDECPEEWLPGGDSDEPYDDREPAM